MTFPLPSSLRNGQDKLGGRSEVAAPIFYSQVSLRGNDGLLGELQPVDNIRNKAPDGGRIVLVGIGGGIAVPFMFWTFHGEQL